MRHEALFPYSLSRAITSSLSKLKRKLDCLYATQEIPQDTHRNFRGTTSFPPKLEKNPVFPTSYRDEGQFPCSVLRGIPSFPLRLKRRPFSPTETREGPCGSCHKSKGHRVLPQLEIPPGSPALTRVEPRVCPHNTKGGLTPLLHL